MNTHRMNITLPKECFNKLQGLPNKSAFIAQAVREKLEASERAQEAEALARAYEEAAKEEGELAGDWDSVIGDAL